MVNPETLRQAQPDLRNSRSCQHIGLLIAAGILAYSNSFAAPFVFDGKYLILQRRAFENFQLTWGTLWQHWRSVTDASFALNFRLGGTAVWGYHAVNLVLHLAAAMTLYDIMRRTLRQGRFRDTPEGAAAEGIALASALIWMLHPLQTETVTYVIQRYELLMGLFCLLTLDCFLIGAAYDSCPLVQKPLNHRDRPGGGGVSQGGNANLTRPVDFVSQVPGQNSMLDGGLGPPAVAAGSGLNEMTCCRSAWGGQWGVAFWWGISLLCLAVDLRTKEAAIIAPLVLLWFDRACVSPSWKTLLRRHGLYYAGVALIGGLLSWHLIEAVGGGVWNNFFPAQQATPLPASTAIVVPGINPIDYALSQPGVILHYLKLSFWPRGLCLDYAWPLARGTPAMLWPVIVICSLMTLGGWAVWRRPGWGFLAGWFFVTLAPRSSFVPHQDLACEHRLYLPLAAIAVGTVLAGFRLLRWSSIGKEHTAAAGPGNGTSRILSSGLTVVVVSVLGGLTFLRNWDYRSERAIWETVVAARPENPRGHLSLAFAFSSLGEAARAIEQFELALNIQPYDFPAQYYCGLECEKLGRNAAAAEHFQTALLVRPKSAEAREHLELVRSKGP